MNLKRLLGLEKGPVVIVHRIFYDGDSADADKF